MYKSSPFLSKNLIIGSPGNDKSFPKNIKLKKNITKHLSESDKLKLNNPTEIIEQLDNKFLSRVRATGKYPKKEYIDWIKDKANAINMIDDF